MNILKIRLPIALFLSLLIISILSSFIYSSLGEFYQYKKTINPNLELTKDRFHFFIQNSIQKEWIRLTAPKVQSDKQSPLRTFRITVAQKDIDSLNANLPTSGKDHFVKAYLTITEPKASLESEASAPNTTRLKPSVPNNTSKPKASAPKIYKIKLRYRGDSNSHWFYTQKSLRVKLAKDDIYDMSKTFNLINPQSQLNYRDSINYQFSKELGLITPKSIPSRVFINGRYMGVYLYLSQVDESILRSHRLMPGSIYYGDNSPIENGIASLWFNPIYWEKKASRNSEQKNNTEDIELFIKGVNSNGKKFNTFAKTYLNLEKYFAFIALDRVFGTQHHDFIHNHKIYFDPYKGKFEPISWDLRFWLPLKAKDLSFYPIQLKLASNPIYDAQIDKIVYSIINNNFINKVDKAYTKIIDQIEYDLKSDIYRDNAVALKQFAPYPISRALKYSEITHDKAHAIEVLKSRVKFLNTLYNNTTIEYHLESEPSTPNTPKKLLTLIIKGNSPAQMDSKLFTISESKASAPNSTKTLFTKRELVPNSQKFFPTSLCGDKTVQNRPNKYQFLLDTNLSSKDIISNIKFTNIITGKIIKPNLYDKIKHNKNIIKHQKVHK